MPLITKSQETFISRTWVKSTYLVSIFDVITLLFLLFFLQVTWIFWYMSNTDFDMLKVKKTLLFHVLIITNFIFVLQAERARMNAENELAYTYARLTEVTLQVTALTNDKLRMKAVISAMQSDLDDTLNSKNAAEERADRLQAEIHRLAEKLRQEQ